jgi:hypothetical protein
MPADNELDPLDRWLKQQVAPLPPPPGTFELITKRARRRRIRKAVVSVASAAAVAAAVGVAVPLSTSLHLTTPSTNAGLAAGSTTPSSATAGSQSTLGSGAATPTQTAPSSAAASGTATPGSTTPSGTAGSTSSGPAYLPPNYVPTSVTWDSLTTGWIIGQAGTPGQCANKNPDICTSIARTDDGGQHWQGVPAPNTGNGVTGLRFLNASYGWAFGPELWATNDGGQHWHQVNTGSLSVPQLETVNGRAYALFASCSSIDGNQDAACTKYTLKTATAGRDNWTPVAGVPGDLTGGTADFTQAAGQQDGAVIEIASATSSAPTGTGYLVAPDGTLYAGPLDGTAWHQAAKLPCAPGVGDNGGGQPHSLQLTPAGVTSSGATKLAMVCTATPARTTSVYLSQDGGSTWTAQAGVASVPTTSTPTSLTALPDGSLILAAGPGGAGSAGGIYLLSPGATQWQAAALSDSSGTKYGFSYVGMTSPTQGVALGGNPNLHAIWMTTDGGKTWQVRPIQK